MGKDEYAVGDITKEVDARMKDEIAKMRGKDEYELGDLICVMDEMSKKMVEDATVRTFYGTVPFFFPTHLVIQLRLMTSFSFVSSSQFKQHY